MDIDCGACVNGVDSIGGSCSLCAGTGLLSLDDETFQEVKIGDIKYFQKQVWLKLLTPDGVFPSYQILECIDATEYNALTDAKKEGVGHILMCGLVDMNDGKAGKTRLWNWFGAESTTVANLTTLIG